MQRGLLLAALTRKRPLFAPRRSLAVARATIDEGLSCHPAKAPKTQPLAESVYHANYGNKEGEDSVELVSSSCLTISFAGQPSSNMVFASRPKFSRSSAKQRKLAAR